MVNKLFYMPLFALLLISSQLVVSGDSTKENKLTLVVADFKSTNVDDALVKIVFNQLIEDIHKTNKYTLVNRDEIQRIINEQKLQQSGMCDATSCYAEIGNALGAEKMIVGSIIKYQNIYQVQAKMIDINKVIDDKIESFTFT